MKTDDLKVQIEVFKLFIKYVKKGNEKILKDIKEEIESQNYSLSFLSRGDKRAFQKENKNYLYNKNDIKNTNNTIKYLKEIIDFLEDENYENTNYKLNNEFNIIPLIYLITVFYNRGSDVIALDSNLPRIILSYFIKNLKSQNVSSNILNCFDKNGKIILDRTIILKIYLENSYNEMLNSNLGILEIQPKEKVVFTIILKENLDKARAIQDEKMKKEFEEKQRIKEEEKQKKLEEERIKKLKNNSTDIHDNIKRVKKNDPEYLLFTKYINPYTYELKKESIEKITYDEFKNILEKLNLTKAQNNKYLDDFNQIHFNKNITSLSRILDKKELKKIKNIIEKSDEYTELFNLIKSFILSEDFSKSNDKVKKEKIKKILDTNYLVSKEEINNYIVFSENNLLKDEIELIYNTKTHENKDAIVKNIYNQLQILKKISIEDIKNSIEDSFHELQPGSKPYIIEDKIKGYRYGAKKIKFGIAILSVKEENLKKLQEIYNTKINNNVVLVFGAGIVTLENETDLYDRIKKYGMDNKQKLLEIYDIFSNPFTNETFKKACELIDKGLSMIDSIKPDDKKELILIEKVED